MVDKSLFYRHYANLPIPTRREVVLTVDEQPISWEVAYREIDANTALGKKILEKLFQLEFIPKK